MIAYMLKIIGNFSITYFSCNKAMSLCWPEKIRVQIFVESVSNSLQPCPISPILLFKFPAKHHHQASFSSYQRNHDVITHKGYLLHTSNRLIDSRQNMQRDTSIPNAKPVDQSQPIGRLQTSSSAF